jgi:hypothetical protein
MGEAYNSNGDNCNGTGLGLGCTVVVNDGSLVLDAQGSGTESGGPPVSNDGTVKIGPGALYLLDAAWAFTNKKVCQSHTGTLMAVTPRHIIALDEQAL